MGTPPLPYRVRPPQVLLGVGAVLLVTAGAATASTYGGIAVRLLLLALAATAAASSVRAARVRLRSSAEVLGGAAAGLALSASSPAGFALDGGPVLAAALAAGFVVLSRLAPTTAAWPVAAWAAGQLAVLRLLDDVPGGLRTSVCLGVSLVGLGIALYGRPVVARVALVTTVPWWSVVVVAGTASAWGDAGVRAWSSAALVLVAAAELPPARLREPLDRLLGPPRAVPVLSGVVSGIAVVGPVADLGPVVLAVSGFGGVLLATLPAVVLTGWRRGLLVPAATAAGVVVAGLCTGQLAAAGRWSALALLLLLTAVPTAVVAVRRRADRAVALPTAVGCLAGAALLALPDRLLPVGGAAALLTALYVVALALGSGLDAGSRRATARAAALVWLAAVLLVAAAGDRPVLAAHLAVQAAATLGWAGHVGARDPALGSAAERVGAAQLVAAAWVGAAAAGLAALEWYSLPAAGGLLVAAGRRLGSGPSWPAWGPGLVVAALPSAVLAVVAPEGPRGVVVLAVAATVLVAGARTGLRAPLVVGAATALWVTVGFAVRALPWPLATALVLGGLLLALGVRRERRPVAGSGVRLADLR